ncbi:MAG TPA: tetratricopeptide repeat protein, partial [Caulobacteraceae bacterium]|nr:tetratricopeptide repeat protein [Caulobacteraceae bacterium]
LAARGQAYLMDNDVQRSTSDFEAALKLDPDSYQILYRRADAYRLAGRYSEAIDQFATLIAKFPGTKHNSALVGRCRAEVALGRQLDQAVSDCDAALAARPSDENALQARGDADLKLGHYDQAVADFSQVLTLRPSDTHAQCGLQTAKSQKAGQGKALPVAPSETGDACKVAQVSSGR